MPEHYRIKAPAGSPSRGGNAAVYVLGINQPSLPTRFYSVLVSVSVFVRGPFNLISFHKSSRQLPAFSLCSSGLISAFLLLSAVCLFMKVSLSPWAHLHMVGMLLVTFLTESSRACPLFLFCSSVCFCLMVLSTVFHSMNSPDNSPLSRSVLPVLFLPFWSFQLYSSL